MTSTVIETLEVCADVPQEMEPSQLLEDIVEGFSESTLDNVMENFGENWNTVWKTMKRTSRTMTAICSFFGTQTATW